MRSPLVRSDPRPQFYILKVLKFLFSFRPKIDETITTTNPKEFLPYHFITLPHPPEHQTSEKHERNIFPFTSERRWKINIRFSPNLSLSLMFTSCFSCVIYFSGLCTPTPTNVIYAAERFSPCGMFREKRRLYCIMLYLKFIARKAKKSKIRGNFLHN